MSVQQPCPADIDARSLLLRAETPCADAPVPEGPARYCAVVTGPTGGVGVNLINELVAHQVRVYAVCRPDSLRLGNLPLHPLVTVVFCPLDALDTLPARIGGACDVFFHLAWAGSYGADRDDDSVQQQNIAATLDAVRAAKALGCTAFAGAGSQSEFGHVAGRLSPDLPCRPDNGYGRAKLIAGQQSRALCRALGLRHCWCRILSLYGPFDGAHTMVMQLVEQLLRKQRPQCTAGDQVWDYLYLKDAARALRLVGERGHDGAIYCVGSGQTRLLRDYILAIRNAVDPALPVGFGERPYYPHQVMHLEADITSLTADTGFLPRYSFEQGIAETVDWMRSRMDAESGAPPL